jgi:hypothetical protein
MQFIDNVKYQSKLLPDGMKYKIKRVSSPHFQDLVEKKSLVPNLNRDPRPRFETSKIDLRSRKKTPPPKLLQESDLDKLLSTRKKSKVAVIAYKTNDESQKSPKMGRESFIDEAIKENKKVPPFNKYDFPIEKFKKFLSTSPCIAKHKR